MLSFFVGDLKANSEGEMFDKFHIDKLERFVENKVVRK